MTLESLSTLFLALTGPITALAVAAVILALRPLAGARNLWAAVWLVGLAVRFGKSTLHALIGLGPLAMNIGLAGMLAAPAALYLTIRAAARNEQSVAGRDLWIFTPALVMAMGSPWIPNAREELASMLIYVAILTFWVLCVIAAWRELIAGTLAAHAERWLLQIQIISTSMFGILFVVIFAGAPSLYLLNGVLFSLVVIVITARLMVEIGTRKRPARVTVRTPTAEQLALIERAREILSDPAVLSDIGTNLTRVARRLGVAPKVLSTSINSVTGESFTTFLNAARIAEARRQLRATADSVEAIAARCGFSSASAFHRTFRRHESTTPSAWRQT